MFMTQSCCRSSVVSSLSRFATRRPSNALRSLSRPLASSSTTLSSFSSNSVSSFSTSACTMTADPPKTTDNLYQYFHGIPSEAAEDEHYKNLVESIRKWMNSPRFRHIKRPYGPEQIASKRGSIPVNLDQPGNLSARKLFATFEKASAKGETVHTLGAVDPVQQSQMAYNQDVVYVSGWACSSVLTTGNNETGPDLADYPYTTVPNQVQRLYKAQLLHDRKMWDERIESNKKSPYVDYLKPIIADGDSGHGGLSSVMKLAKLFGEAGVSGVHIEDQLHGGKKCGHQAGKVLVPTSEHVSRLIAFRTQWDIMGLETLLIARTDAESAKLISSTVDPRDHEFILGVETFDKPDIRPLVDVISSAERAGKGGSEIDSVEAEWTEKVQLVTFNQAVENALKREGKSDADYQKYLSLTTPESSFRDLRKAAKQVLGKEVEWDCDLPRTREGYYHFNGGTEAALKRTLSFGEYSDMLWLETKNPDLEQAQHFSKVIKAKYPHMWLVYNLSPSFNWSAHGFSDQDLKNFVFDLGKAGYVFQLISLAGIHTIGTLTAELSRRFKTDGMLAYVELVQRKEKELGIDLLTHQKWSGASYIDRVLGTAVQAGSSATAASGKDSTENTF